MEFNLGREVIPVTKFKKRIYQSEVLSAIERGELDIALGDVMPLKKFIKKFKREQKI